MKKYFVLFAVLLFSAAPSLRCSSALRGLKATKGASKFQPKEAYSRPLEWKPEQWKPEQKIRAGEWFKAVGQQGVSNSVNNPVTEIERQYEYKREIDRLQYENKRKIDWFQY